MNASDTQDAIARVHRGEWGRLVASLAARFGDLNVAEEAAAEAFAIAVERWPSTGLPPNPGAWLATTATRKAIDHIRRERNREQKHRAAQMTSGHTDPAQGWDVIRDDRLRLIFTCCHPALPMDARVALTLRLVSGLTVAEIARAFLVSEAAMAQRITRAKTKIKTARIPYRVPVARDLPARVSGVLAVLFLVFNEGYLPTSADNDAVRPDLSEEAIRLTRLTRALLPCDDEVAGLLALMLLSEARRPARVSSAGVLVALGEQDRGAWDKDLVAEGHQLVRLCLKAAAAGATPGRYQILAAINAVHTSARDIRQTDWSQILALYNQLVNVDASPVVALNRTVALAEVEGPRVALAAADRLQGTLTGYHAFHATRADLLRRLGRDEEARDAYEAAIKVAGNTAEIALLEQRRDQLESVV
ncbi:RNA polymerase sigma factor [Microlunatus flavus]|uniref:RNA polymerase sigma-70 factor, ECF subfamily n=1 Tax=Microlunatus flavus TaxID=1036181 RepID=A0A1H9L6F3_9ACTN|nr:DUF6596 domain-containing protein [Microlunatus flavus]SER07081.1 RNA polymerase sigma-70 factor, ECF subfamily [Microlunatus flavus]